MVPSKILGLPLLMFSHLRLLTLPPPHLRRYQTARSCLEAMDDNKQFRLVEDIRIVVHYRG